jgi:hypothetical protein
MYFIVLVILLFGAGYATRWVYKSLNAYFDTDNRVFIQRLGITILTLILCALTFGGTLFVVGYIATEFIH